MKILYIVAHPNVDKSFNHRLAENGVKYLKSREHEVNLLDLYKCNYNPLIRDPDHEQMVKHLENLKWCDLVIIQFPLYWWSSPAILKGYIDFLMVLMAEENKEKKRRVKLCSTAGGNYSVSGMNNFLSHLTDQMKRGGFEVLKSCYQFGVNFASESKRLSHIKYLNKVLGDIKEE